MATGYKYSLALVKAVITIPGIGVKTFGGQGSMIGNITLSRKNDRFSAEGDATGGYVINETLDGTGTCTISIKQFAPLVNTLINCFNNYDTNIAQDVIDINEEGEFSSTAGTASSIELYYGGMLVGKAEGCYLNMPELAFEEENGNRDFTFECGHVSFELLNNRQVASEVASTGAVATV